MFQKSTLIKKGVASSIALLGAGAYHAVGQGRTYCTGVEVVALDSACLNDGWGQPITSCDYTPYVQYSGLCANGNLEVIGE
jgi:hypothetical protein